MAFTKHASLEGAQVLELRSSPVRRTASFDRLADFQEYRTEDGFLYARIRAISSRVNRNHDGWPSIELAGGQDIFDRHTSSADGFSVTADSGREYGFSTFLGKPIFIDHHNSDPSRARGVIVDARFHVEDHKTASLDSYYASKEVDSSHLPPAWVELLLEIDAKQFPKFAKAVVEGSRNPRKGIDGWSMGADVSHTKCSVCSNVAHDPDEYCKHVKLKGAYFDHVDPHTGTKTSKKAYENCFGVRFFEISGVFDPADETALSLEYARTAKSQEETVVQNPREKGAKDIADELNDELLEETEREKQDRKRRNKTASLKLAENPPPQSEMAHAPENVDTLREERVCPVCGSSMDEDTCSVCGFQEPPDGFGNPDLTKVQDVDVPTEPQDDPRVDAPGVDPTESQPGPAPGTAPPVNTPSNPALASHVTNDMEWDVHSRTAARINQVERPLASSSKPQSDEPQEKILADQLRPKTSRVRTAAEFIAATNATRRTTHMNHTADAASGAPADAKPDVKTDVIGVGGVDQASNDAASKADKQIDVTGIGGTGVESVSAEKEGVNVEQGDEHSKNIEAIHTDTWGPNEGDSLGQRDPVTSEPFPASADGVRAVSRWVVEAHDDAPFPDDEIGSGAAVQGVQPITESFGERVNVKDHVTSPSNNSGPTTTWSGTDGNGVNKQQDPVTNDSIARGESGMTEAPNWTSSTHIFAAFKLADLEVGMGLIPAAQRYARAAELEREAPLALDTALRYAQRVNKAARRTAATQKLPVMGRPVDFTDSTEKTASTQSEDSGDEAFMFGGV